MMARKSLPLGKKVQICNPSVSITLSSVESGRQALISRIGCDHHGLECPSESDKRYLIFVRNTDTGRELCSQIFSWSELEYVIELGDQSRIAVTVYSCRPLAETIYGFQVVSLTSSSSTSPSSTPTVSSPSSSSSVVEQFARLTLDRAERNIDVSVTRSTYCRASIKWTWSPSLGRQSRLQSSRSDKWLITVSRINDINNMQIVYFYVDGAATELDLPVELSGGAEYRVGVRALRKRPETTDWYDTVEEGIIEFRAELTSEDLHKLYEAAVEFSCLTKVGTYVKSAAPCKWFYRNRWEEYFDEIDTVHNGIMEVYIKDNSGDQASPINGKLNGLFFMAKNVNGQPPRESPFGRIRLQVPAQALLNNAPNMYFADFYCLGGRIHYVTIVMTRPDSDADEFCRARLLPLDLKNNPFLYRSGVKLFTANRKQLCIELFYTENVNIKDFIDRCGAIRSSGVPCPKRCKGRSTPGGIPKNRSCPKCNPVRQIGEYDTRI